MNNFAHNNTIELVKISKRFGDLQVLDNYSTVFEQGKVYAIHGASGCGKTTLLRVIAGLTLQNSGRLIGLEPEQWHIVYMFQEDRLLPWANVRQNIELVLDNNKKYLVEEILQLVGLGEFATSLPVELSGGMQRRVALARSLVYLQSKKGQKGEILLLDEPFKGMDDDIKHKLINYIVNNKTVSQITIIVTHDKKEAEALADKVLQLTMSED